MKGPEAERSSSLRYGALLGGRFELREVAGAGAMGIVHRAIDRDTGLAVAVKVLSAEGASDLARFEREARVLAELSHPHIVRYVGRGVSSDDRPYLVLEWLEGETLASRLGHVVPTIEETVALARVLAGAIEHAHALGIVHRDIKPANVFLVGNGFGDPRLLDFGVARLMSGSAMMTRTGMALGTPVYMAPEQARGGKDVDARADLYALGCLVFECVAGQVPFDGDDLMAVLAKVLFADAPRLSTLAPAAPEGLEDLVARLLEKDPQRRLRSAREVVVALDAVEAELRSSGPPASIRPSARPPRPITEREQKLVAVVAVGPRTVSAGGGVMTAATLAVEAMVPVTQLAARAASFEASFSPLANGSCVAVIEGQGAASDLALRAARCALAFRSQCDLPVALVMGQAMGGRVPVGAVIDRVGTLVRGGDAAAERGAVAIDTLAADLLERRFEIEAHEGQRWLVRERDEPEHRALLLGRPAPFVGRGRELRVLAELFEEACAERAARMVVVTGPPGIGKSRLVAEWLGALSERVRSGEIEVWSGRSDPHEDKSPLGLVASALRSAARVVRGDPVSIAQDKMRRRIARDFDGPEVERMTQLACELVGAPVHAEVCPELSAARTDPALMGDQLRRTFERIVDGAAARRPLVIVLEDAQWGDTSSARFIESALRAARGRPVFVCVVGRADRDRTPMGIGATRGVDHLSLGELPLRACRAFVEAVLPDLDEALASSLLDRASGNAFFLEELVRIVGEARARGGEEPLGEELPATVLATVQARLSSLPADARRFLRAASVFGHAFWLEGVAELLGGTTSAPASLGAARPETLRVCLDVLVAEELIEPRAPSRFPAHEELRFRHALVRDAAYATLTERDRAAGHRLARGWLEGAGEGEALVLAEHALRSEDPRRAAGWLVRAASRALEAHDLPAAIELVQRGRDALASDVTDESFGALLLIEAEARRWSGDFVAAERAARRAVEALPAGTARYYDACAELAAIAGARSDFRSIALWRETIAPAPLEDGARVARLGALAAVGRRLFQLGDYEAAEEVVSLVEDAYRALAAELDPRSEAEVLRLLGARARHAGRVAEDLRFYGAALDAYGRAGDERGACNARVSHAFSRIQLGDFEGAARDLDGAEGEAKRLGLANVTTRIHQNRALVLLARGDAAEALSLCEQVVAEARARGDERFEGWTRIYAARAAVAVGDPERSRTHARAATRLLDGSPPALAGALAALALAEIELGEADAADLAAEEALAILTSYEGIEEFESLVWLAAVRAAAASKDLPRARDLHRRAKGRIAARAAAIEDADTKRSFLEQVMEHAALMSIDEGTLPRTLAPLAPPTPMTRDAWSAGAFEADAGIIVPLLARHLGAATSGGEVTRGFPGPAEMLERFAEPLGAAPITNLDDLATKLLASSPHQHSPRYMGHQVAAALPRASLLALLGAVLNNGMAAYESGPAVTVMERRVIEWMGRAIGFREGGGILTSGGSLGNLTALLAARQARAGFDVRGRGLAEGPRLAVLVSEQAHYSVARAAQIMGIGQDGVFAVPTDDRFRVDARAIVEVHARAIAAGARPFAMIASAGATGTGSIDPLAAVADACASLGLWLHVDGAHGASALLSPRYRGELAGIERADSVVWDAHKLLSMPALATGVVFRDASAPYATFAQEAAYLFNGDPAGRWFDIGLRTVECTKTLLALPIYGCLATMGEGVFRDAIEHAYDLARWLAGHLATEKDFELACPPDSNIVCFRHVPAGVSASALDALQAHVVERMRERGRFYCVKTALRGTTYLRTSLMNPLTTTEHVLELLEEIRGITRSESRTGP